VNATLSCPGAGRQAALAGADEGRRALAGFRGELYRCLTRRPDALFELADSVLCEDRRVSDLARLSLVPEFRRGHGALYDALNAGRAGVARLRVAVAALPLPAWPDGRIRLAADVSNWLRPDAAAQPGPDVLPREGAGQERGQPVPGWPYSFVAAPGPGASSWALPLDAVRLGPGDDETEVTAAQLREVTGRLIAAGHWKDGDPDVVIVLDSGYCASRLAFLLEGLPVLLVVRVRSDRVSCRPPGSRPPGTGGHPARHGPALSCAAPGDGPAPQVTAAEVSPTSRDAGGDGLAPGAPEAAGAVRRLGAPPGRAARHRGDPHPADRRHRAGGQAPLEPMWLRAAEPQAGPDEVAVLWHAYLRRFDLEHLFRFIRSRLGWNRPLLRDPEAADRWTWLVVACCAQLWLARSVAAAPRLPWQRPQPPGTMTPGRVRAGFRHAREDRGQPGQPAETRKTRPRAPARIEE